MRSKIWLPFAASVATLALGATASATTFIGERDVFNYFGGYATIAGERGPQKVSIDGFAWMTTQGGGSGGELERLSGTIQIGRDKFYIAMAPGSAAIVYGAKSSFLTNTTGLSFVLRDPAHKAAATSMLSGDFLENPLSMGKGVLYLTGSLVNGFPAAGVALPDGHNGLTARDIASQAVPEPTTWAMMLIGLGGIGWTMRRRRLPRAVAA